MQLNHYIYRELTMKERGIIHRIKVLACFIGIALGLCGCSSLTIYHGWGIVNNTDFILIVHQDGKLVGKMPPGTTFRLEQHICSGEFSLVTVAAYNTGSDFRGADSYTFSKFAPYNWQIDHIHKRNDL